MKLLHPYSARLAASLALALAFGSAHAQNSNMGASDKISVGTASLLASPLASVQGSGSNGPGDGSALALVGGSYVVGGLVQGTGESVEVVLTSASTGAKFSVRMAGSAAKASALAAGSAVQAVAEASGVLLVSSGKVLAFIPNEIGKALLAQSALPRP